MIGLRTFPRVRLVWGALVAVLMLLSFGAGLLTPRFTTPGDDSADAGFARDMSIHHAQAVEMAMFAFQRASTEHLRVIGYDIAMTQQYQIGAMKTWLDEWNVSPSGSDGPMSWIPNGRQMIQPDGRMPGMASTDELTKLKSATGKDFDILFCQLMIRHHLGGAHMAESAVKLADEEQVRNLASQMINSQRADIANLNDILRSLGAEPIS